jgi:hypothetical protein
MGLFDQLMWQLSLTGLLDYANVALEVTTYFDSLKWLVNLLRQIRRSK